jgi:superfamily II DNA helicase RecQ
VHFGMNVKDHVCNTSQVDVIYCFTGAVCVVRATVAFGMGMVLPDIRLVVHWNEAHSLLDFVRQKGNAGSDDKPCMCLRIRAADYTARMSDYGLINPP